MSLSLNQFLMLYMWFPLAALLLFLLLIARFFDRFSGHRTYYRLLILPILLFGVGAVRYAGVTRIAGVALADISFGLGGMILLILSLRLYWLMIVDR